MMKPAIFAAALSIVMLPLANSASAARDPSAPPRNSANAAHAPTALHGVTNPNGVGLAPTTWGFTSKYSGSLYGSGYYPFRVDLTYGGLNSIYGYTFNYPSIGFVNDIRGVYVFDISSLVGQTGPLWSAFMFDVRQPPTSGAAGVFVLGGVQLGQTGPNYSLQGLALQQETGAAKDVDVYDAEDFENAAPFDNPEAAFIGNNTQIGTFSLPDSVATAFNIDVTAAVNNDAGPGGTPLAPAMELPALDSKALAAIALLLLGGGLLAMRRRV
jgi:hypothetical protein